MKKITLYIIMTVFVLDIGAQSIANIDTSLLIEDITIQQNRINTPLSESARFINIVTKEEIEKLPVTSISELLQYTGAIDIRRRGVNGVQADAGIRGSTFNQILILINGVRMSDPQTGHHMMNLPIALEDVERIEVIKGPAARIFGMNAMAGAINIITKNNHYDGFKMKAGVTISDFETFGLNISAHIPGSVLSQSLSLTRQGSEGYRYNTDYNINTAYYQADIHLSQNAPIQLQAGFTEREFGANGFYANESFKDQYEEVRTGFLSATTTINKGNLLIKPRLSWRTNKDEYVFLRKNPSFFMNEHRSNSYIAELHSTYLSRYGETGLGLDFNRETLSSNNLGERKRTILGIFIEQRMHFINDKLSATIGFYGNQVSDNNFKIYPGIDLSYKLSPNMNLFATANWSDRIPTYTNLYYTSSSEQGNENLVSESSASFEVGGKFNVHNLSITLSAFKRTNSNLIDWAKDSTSQEKWLALNFNEVNMLGTDFSLKYVVSESRGINLKVDYTYINAEIIDDAAIAVSRYALDNLSQQLIAGLDIDILPKKLSLHTNYRYLDRVSLEDYQLIDMKLSYKGSNFNAFINANNVLDTEYRETNLVPMPGRWFGIGFQFF
jgi:vitamin B12 transporter